MGQLQEMFERALNERVRDIAIDRICEKLEAEGLAVSPRQRKRIAKALDDGSNFSLRFWRWPPWRFERRKLVISDEDRAAIQKEWGSLLGSIEAAVPEFTDHWESVVREEVRHYPGEIASDARAEQAFRKRLAARWRTPLTLLQVIIALSERLAVESLEGEPTDNSPAGTLEAVLRRLHARGVRVAKEGLLLLQGGYADGAMARWRTLHELTTIALFIQVHGEDCARAYLAHDAVESYRSALHYKRAHEKLGYEPISADELADLEESFRSAIEHFGKEFGGDYGWAYAFLGGRASHFSEIEASLSLAHLRPYYRMASQQVHAGTKGILFGLSHDPDEVVLLGPSNGGLADPGQSIGLTLSLLTTVFLTLHPSIDLMVGVKVQASLSEVAAEEWVSAQLQLEADEAEIRRAAT